MNGHLHLELMDNLLVVLVRPRFPENIGAAARVTANMGLGGLRVVAPERLWKEPMERMATAQGMPVLEAMQVHEDLGQALAGCVGALATTARVGPKRGRLIPPRAAAPQMLQYAASGKAALVFGPEDKGLNTTEIDLCSLTVCIPTAKASSLNLAQAVMTLAYEMRISAMEAEGLGRGQAKKPAPMGELEGLKSHLKEALTAIGVFIPDNPDHFFRPFKNVLDRAKPTSAEVRALRGMARQMLWLAGQLEEQE
jgi:tRNA/rRNA methyltransferase